MASHYDGIIHPTLAPQTRAHKGAFEEYYTNIVPPLN